MTTTWKQMLPDLLPEYHTERGKRIYTDRTRYFMNIVENGIPPTNNPRRVAVVGAGVSGLVAASILAKSGHEVAIFETSSRIGGRVTTVRSPFTDGHHSEAGAMRLVDSYQLVYQYIKQFNLQTYPFINNDKAGKQYIYVNNVKTRYTDYLANPDILNFPTVGAERGKTAEQLWLQALKPINDMVNPEQGRDTVENWAKVVERYGQHSVNSYLNLETDLSSGAIEMIEVMVDLESRSSLSLMQQIVETIDHRPGTKYAAIVGGMDQLTNKLSDQVKALGVPIYFNSHLEQIDQDADGVTLRFDSPDIRASNTSLLPGVHAPPRLPVFQSDAAILTIPFPAMRYLKTTPPFSHNKRKAVRELNYNASTKIFLQFSERFWEKNDGIFGGQTITDLPCRFIYYPSNDMHGDNGGVVIASYTWASEARGWDSLSPNARVQYALDNVAEIHGEYIRDSFVVGTSHSWLIDSCSMGEAAMLTPGQFIELEGAIQQPEGNIHFGGDATSFKVAWIEGAIEAGIRTAVEVAGEHWPTD